MDDSRGKVSQKQDLQSLKTDYAEWTGKGRYDKYPHICTVRAQTSHEEQYWDT